MSFAARFFGLPFLSLLALAPRAAAGGDEASWVWWEAEDALRHNFDPRHEFSPEHEILSGGRWIGISGPREKTIFAEYEVDVPEAGVHKFYVRKFWKHGPFRYRFGEDGEWSEIGRDVALMDSVSIRTHLSANWVYAGEVRLPAGKTRLRVELLERDGAACFDSFLLTPELFDPRGKLKPGERYGRAPEGWFPFEPGRDRFGESPIDLRFLNEPEAGSKGFIAAEGERFVHGEAGEPVRFWAANVNKSTIRMDRDEIDSLARLYAKRGVNLVRYHSPVFEGDSRWADPETLDDLFYLVAAMKREGIYTHLSIYFQHWNTMDTAAGRNLYLADYGYEDGQKPFVLHFVDESFQEIMRGWWRDLLSTENPYTGKPLARDPAVMGCELLNEDNYFFYTFAYDRVPEPVMAKLEARYADWVRSKYGSLEAALDAWDEPLERDSVEEGRLQLHSAAEMAREPSPRAASCAAFLARDERRFFEEMGAYLKETLGFGGVVTATNWKTASARRLEPLEKWANGANDFMDHHGYFGRPYQKVSEAFGVQASDRYRDRTATRFESVGDDPEAKSFSIPSNLLVWHGQPHMISEIAWVYPNRHRGEQAPLVAAYGALQGLDAVVWFSTDGSAWQPSIRSQWPIQNPSQLGQWPAAALIFRQGLAAQAEPAARVTLDKGRIFALEGQPVAQTPHLDAMQAEEAGEAGGAEGAEAAPDVIDELAFFVGPIRVDFAEEGGVDGHQVETAALGRYIRRAEREVASSTGELLWDWGAGLVTLEAPAAQFAVGSLGANAPIELGQVRIESDLEYGSVSLVSLDGRPIESSDRILLQVFAEDMNYGWTTSEADGWKTIEDVGQAPIVARELSGAVSLKRSDAAALKVTALDDNGYPVGDAGTADRVELRPDTLYYCIER